MAFIGKPEKGVGYQPGWFLAHEECTRVTKNFDATDSENITVKDGPNGGKYVPMGSTYKAEGTPVGIVYEDVDVSLGEAAGSVVIAGTVYKDRLEATAQTEVDQIETIQVIEKAPEVKRPPDKDAE